MVGFQSNQRFGTKFANLTLVLQSQRSQSIKARESCSNAKRINRLYHSNNHQPRTMTARTLRISYPQETANTIHERMGHWNLRNNERNEFCSRRGIPLSCDSYLSCKSSRKPYRRKANIRIKFPESVKEFTLIIVAQ